MKYTQPKMEIVEFESDDIIATSATSITPSLPTYLDPWDSIGGELG